MEAANRPSAWRGSTLFEGEIDHRAKQQRCGERIFGSKRVRAEMTQSASSLQRCGAANKQGSSRQETDTCKPFSGPGNIRSLFPEVA
jgi:hypothetical protein